MKRISSVVIGAATLVLNGSIYAAGLTTEEENIILERQQSISNMEFKRDQLKIQAEMSMAIKQMSDAGILVDENGNPAGVESFTSLANEVRGRAAAVATANPFEAAGMMPQPIRPPEGNAASTRQRENQDIDGPVGNGRMRLMQVNHDSVVVRTETGDRVLRVGDKVNGLALQKFDTSRAFLKGDNGVEVLTIDWPKARR